MKAAVLLQASMGALSLLILDSGQTTRAFVVALLCQWAMAWIILLRRPKNPTRFDLLLVRYGIIPLLFIVAGAGPPLLRLVGLQEVHDRQLRAFLLFNHEDSEHGGDQNQGWRVW